jgi:tetratricopeptide (TPR) repeat protein
MRNKIIALAIAAIALGAIPAFGAGGGSIGGGSMGGGDMGSPIDSGMGGGPTPAELQDKYNEGVADIEREDWKTAVKRFSYVTDYLPKMADAWNYLGYSQRKGGNPKKSEAAYKKALKIDPNHPRANEYYGELLVELNRTPEAEQRLAVLKACCASDPVTGQLASFIEAHRGDAAAGPLKPSTAY